MKHLAKIQKEFVKKALDKKAAKWEDLSYEAQKKYLGQHPASKKRMTAKPGQGGADLHELVEEKREEMLLPEIDSGSIDVGYDGFEIRKTGDDEYTMEWGLNSNDSYDDFESAEDDVDAWETGDNDPMDAHLLDSLDEQLASSGFVIDRDNISRELDKDGDEYDGMEYGFNMRVKVKRKESSDKKKDLSLPVDDGDDVPIQSPI